MSFLTETDIAAIDEAGRRILSEVGIRIHDDRFLKRLKAAGVPVDESDGRARLRPEWVEDRLARAPAQFTLHARDGKNDLLLGSGRVYFGNGGRVFQILDLATGGFRPTVLRDVAHTAALVDAMEHIRFYIIACQAGDLAPDHYHRNDFYQALLYTTKHVMGGVDDLAGARQMVGLAGCIAGGDRQLREKPFVSVITNPISPLTLDSQTLQILEFCARRGVPVTCAPAPISGATAPASLAGTLAQLHAEALAGASLVQFMAPGAPVMYGAVASAMDLRTMDLAMGSVEASLINTGAVALAHRCQLPIYATAGLTDAKLPDIQAGFEKGVSNLLLGMAGADYVHLAAGMIDSGNSIAYEQLVIDNEILGMVERVLQGITVNTETLGVDCIKNVGPGGHFVLEEHTVRHMFSEFFYPRLAIREQFDKWAGRGEPTPLSNAQAVVRQCLENAEARLNPDSVAAVRRRFPEIVDLESN